MMKMIKAQTVLNIIEEGNIEVLKNILPQDAYALIVKKYVNNDKPFIKKVVKKYEQKRRIIERMKEMERKPKLVERLIDQFD